MQNKTFQAAVYLRLSREDGAVTDGGKQVSNSIANQNELVMDFLKSHPEISVVSTYTDDGYSGVNFERPEFQQKDILLLQCLSLTLQKLHQPASLFFYAFYPHLVIS